MKKIIISLLALAALAVAEVEAQTAFDAGSSGTYAGITNNVAINVTNTTFATTVPNLTYLDLNGAKSLYAYVTTQCLATTNLAETAILYFNLSPDATVWTTNGMPGTFTINRHNGTNDVTSVIKLDLAGSGARYVRAGGIGCSNSGNATNCITNVIVKYKASNT